MAASVQSTLDSIERRRAQLQDSVEKLSAALNHWTTWEAEYTLFKEEISSASGPSPSQMREIAEGLDATLLNEKEVGDLLGSDRDANQVVDRVQRRIDYVQQNSAAVERQLDAAEKQLAGVDVLLDPGVDNEEGLPMMDIEEELDEEGNAVSSSVNQTGKGAAEVVEALRKAGIQKADLEKMMQGAGRQAAEEAKATDTAAAVEPLVVTEPASVPIEASPTTSSEPDAKSAKKSVSFASEVGVEPARGRAALEKDGYNEDFDALNFTRGTKVIELDQDDNLVASYPIIPQGESPEDAELRRQMLQYGLSEVGQVVAELDLDQPTAEYSDFDDDYDDEDEDEDEEDEDEYGRSTVPGVTDDYRQQMLDLERKLNARMLENIGPQASSDETVEQVESVRLLKIQKDEKFDSTIDAAKPKPPSQPGKKGVRFADGLDVSSAPQPVRAPEPAAAAKPVATIADTIVERPAQPLQPPTAPSKPAKVSRFKSARNEPSAPLPNPQAPTPQPTPTGPAGRTLANTIVERDFTSTPASEPDEFDPQVLNREIAVEYHKARNKFIQQQGGFKPTDEDERSPIVEERNGKERKVSRFMAAKLRAEGM